MSHHRSLTHNQSGAPPVAAAARNFFLSQTDSRPLPLWDLSLSPSLFLFLSARSLASHVIEDQFSGDSRTPPPPPMLPPPLACLFVVVSRNLSRGFFCDADSLMWVPMLGVVGRRGFREGNGRRETRRLSLPTRVYLSVCPLSENRVSGCFECVSSVTDDPIAILEGWKE